MRSYPAIVIALVCMCACGANGGDIHPGDISTDIADGATGVALDSSFTVIWPKVVTAASVTDESFFLVPAAGASTDAVKGPYDAAVCEASRSVDATLVTSSDALTSTLTPSFLAPNTTYYLCLSPAISFWDDSLFAGYTGSFETSRLSAAFLSKTSVAFVDHGDIVLVFDLGEESAGTLALDVAEVGSDTTEATGSCATSDNRIVQCTVKDVAGYTDFVDYRATLTLNGAAVASATFNSADREFDNDAYYQWWFTTVLTGDATAGMGIDTAAGVLAVNLALADNTDTALALFTKNYDGDIAFSARVVACEVTGPGDADSAWTGAGLGSGDELERGLFAYQGYDVSVGTLWWLQLNRGAELDWQGRALDGVAAPAAICLVSKEGVLRAYASRDGASWIRMDDDNLSCAVGTCGSYEGSSSGWTDPASAGVLFNLEAGTVNGEYSSTTTIDYFRFRSTGIGGSELDCPML